MSTLSHVIEPDLLRDCIVGLWFDRDFIFCSPQSNKFTICFLECLHCCTAPQTIRLDGDYNPRHLSRDDLVALLKARTANAVHSVRTLRLGAHASAVQLLKVPTWQHAWRLFS